MKTSLPSIGRDSVIVRVQDLPASSVDDDTVILNLKTGRYVGLDAVATQVWAAIDGPARVGHLCATLAAEFRESAEIVERDLIPFLDEMLQEGLIRVDP